MSTKAFPSAELRDAETNRRLLEAAAAPTPVERERRLEDVVVLNLPLAAALARRYRGRGVDLDDLIQVARLGLVLAVRRYDPRHTSGFSAYAVPTITGDLRKYFRDHGWSVRPPRRVQEASLKLRSTTAELTQSLGRTPGAAELAEAVGCDQRTIEQAQLAAEDYHPLSLDCESGSRPGALTLSDSLGDLDPELDRVEARTMLRPLLERLHPRQRRVLEMRFVDGLTQREVGEVIGVSQMQVSRIISDTLTSLRQELGAVAA